MGSDSDWPTMKSAADVLTEFEIPFEVEVVSAHRTPDEMIAFGRDGRLARPPGDHRRSRWGGPPPGHARQRHHAAA